MKVIDYEQHDIRLTLRIPRKGRVIIEGNRETVSAFWNDVKQEFIARVSHVLQTMDNIKGEFEPVTIEGEQHGNQE